MEPRIETVLLRLSKPPSCPILASAGAHPIKMVSRPSHSECCFDLHLGLPRKEKQRRESLQNAGCGHDPEKMLCLNRILFNSMGKQKKKKKVSIINPFCKARKTSCLVPSYPHLPVSLSLEFVYYFRWITVLSVY